MLTAFAPDNLPARVTARTSPAKRSHVPSEFRGLARRLRSRIADDAKQAHELSGQLLEPFRPRPGFTPMPRKARIELLSKCWQAMPSYGRLRIVYSHVGSKFSLAEFRAEPAEIYAENWHANEPAIGVSLRVITIDPPRFEENCIAMTAVGLHAVGRRYQCGPDKDDKLVLNDLLSLALQVPQIVRTDGEFVVPVNGGGWVGAFREHDNMVLVSTFLSAQQLQTKAQRRRA
jgi:hypothetical protein